MIVGLYRHRDSALHRARPGIKLAALPLGGTLLFLLPAPLLAGIALAFVLALYRLAGFTERDVWRQLRPLLPVLALVFVAQLWFTGGAAATLSIVRLTALLLLAALLTLTTRTSDLVATLESAMAPFRFLGVDPATVALAISMALRFIPMVSAIVAEVREAQAARGTERSVLRLTVPVIVRLLKASDEIAEAIDARR